MAVLHNKSENLFNQKYSNTKIEKVDKTVFDFLDDVLNGYDKNNVRIYNGNAVCKERI